ncbi:Helicase associated domain protein [Kitasatospora aureofaciens]|uniref:DEAD/DEAH box helicase n=1 Tax=Kitasatospora aureofaciens TaxID=1894 RepID=UPI0037C68EA0
MTLSDSRTLRTPLRHHQRTGVDLSVNAFTAGASRATLYAATGTGKSLMALNVTQALAPAGRTLVVVPTLQLLEQTAATWQAEGRPGSYLGLCSRPRPDDPSLLDRITLTSSIDQFVEAVMRADGPVNAFVSYPSLGKLAKAHAAYHLPAWDLLVADEAHRCAGRLAKAWGIVHDDNALPARRRLYMTATPRVMKRSRAGREGDCEVASMDDLSLYGPVVYRISLAESIDQGLLADYRLAVVEVHDEDLRAILNRDGESTPTTEGLRVAAAQVALLRAMETYDLRRVLSFHSRVAAARVFARTLPQTADLMPDTMRSDMWVGTVSAGQDSFERRAAFSAFAQSPFGTDEAAEGARRAVLTNCRLCLEGIDVPAIDAVFFADPKTSTIDIVQAVGRALRQVPGTGKVATILVPAYIAPGQDPKEGMRASPFHLLYQVMIALAVYDEHVIHRVDHVRLDDKLRLHPPVVGPERADEVIALLALNELDVHHNIAGLALASAQRYHAEHGHLDVPSRYCGPDRFYLGWWLGHQRSLRKNGYLPHERIRSLDALGMRWEHPRHSIESRLQTAREYARRHGHLAPLVDESFDGVRIGRWLAICRQEVLHGTMPYPYQRALNDIDPWWNAPWPAQWQRTYAQALTAARNGQLAFPDPRGTSDDPLLQWLDQQIDNLPHLSPDQHNLLGALPMNHPLAILLRRPRSPSERIFVRVLVAARAFRRKHGHLDVPYNCTWPGGRSGRIPLGHWISEWRLRPHQLTREQLDALQAVGMRWIPRRRTPSARTPTSHVH